MNYELIINKYYPEENELKHILMVHSRLVADKALRIVDSHPELHADRQFVEEASMLHDIGIFLTNAPGIYCFGTEPYIRHGILGAQLVRNEGFERHARVCERHTGSGITVADIQKQSLPLPLQDYLPVTIEEQIICYADKFFSKTHLEYERTVDEACNKLLKFGEDGTARFRAWAKIFE